MPMPKEAAASRTDMSSTPKKPDMVNGELGRAGSASHRESERGAVDGGGEEREAVDVGRRAAQRPTDGVRTRAFPATRSLHVPSSSGPNMDDPEPNRV